MSARIGGGNHAQHGGGKAPSLVALFAVLLVLVAPEAQPAAAAVPPRSGVSGRLDLSAMALVPSGLSWSGFGVGLGKTWDVEQVANAQSEDTGRAAEPYVAGLRAAGFVREHRLRLGLPDPASPGNSRVTVESYVNEFTTASGAVSGFTLLEDETDVPDMHDVPAAHPIGDQTDVTVSSGVSTDTFVPFNAIDVSFRDGSLYGGVVVHAFTPDDASGTPAASPAASFPQPTVADVELLAQRLLERMTAVRQGAAPAPGLSTHVLRLTGTGVDGCFDDYDQLAGVAFPFIDETDADRALRVAAYGAAIDVYDLEYFIDQNPYAVMRLYRFPDVSAAATWIKTTPTQMSALPSGYVGVRRLSNALDAGDASIGFSYRFNVSDSTAVAGYRLYVQVGATVAMIQIDADPGVSLEAMKEMLTVQAGCLRTVESCAPINAPADLVGSEPPATPSAG